MAGSDGSGMEDDDGYTVVLWLHGDRGRQVADRVRVG
jgi:hypothetical protein